MKVTIHQFYDRQTGQHLCSALDHDDTLVHSLSRYYHIPKEDVDMRTQTLDVTDVDPKEWAQIQVIQESQLHRTLRPQA